MCNFTLLFEEWAEGETKEGGSYEEDSFVANDMKLDPNWVKQKENVFWVT